MVGAKYSGFILQKPHNAVLKEVRSYVGIYSREGVIKKINFFILSIKTPRIFSTQVATERNTKKQKRTIETSNQNTQQFNKSGKMVSRQKFSNIIGFCPTIKSLNWLPQNKTRGKRRKHFASLPTLTLSLQFHRILDSNYCALKDT